MPRWSTLQLAAAVLVPGAPPASPAQDRPTPPDLVLLRGKVFTADSVRPWAEALAITGERITAVGTTSGVEALAGPATARLELGGRVVVPGFNDAHAHVATRNADAVRFSPGGGPFADVPFANVLDSVARLARVTAAGTWIISSVGPRAFDDSSARRDALDRVAPRNPVFLHGAGTGHGSLLNTAALRALGVSDAAADPVGGWHERQAAPDGTVRISGLLHEYAGWVARRRLALLRPPAEHAATFRRYADESLRYGVTSVQDMAGDLGVATSLRGARDAGVPLRLRLIRMPQPDVTGRKASEWQSADWDPPSGPSGPPAPLTTVSGLKWILDGTPVERLAVMRRPYADRPGWYGRANFPPDTVEAILREALASDEQLMLHVAGDSMPALVLALMRRLASDSVWRERRVRFEHGDGMAPDLLPAARALGIIVVQNPSHLATPDVMRRRLGGDAATFQPLGSLVAAGIPLALGSDGPVNPFLNIMFATTHPTNPPEALSREQAVAAYTRGSAYAERAEGTKGTLAAGMLADLAVLSQDIFTVPVQALPRTESVLTIIGGRVVFDAGVLGSVPRTR